MDGAVEEHVLLQHHADLTAQPARIELGGIDAVDEDLSALGQVQALDDLGERRLARTGGPDDADHLAGGDREIDVLQDLGCVRAIAQGDATQFDAALERGHGDHVLRRRLGRGEEDVAEALDRDLDLLEILPELRQAQDGLDHLSGDHVEGDEFADCHLAVHHGLGADEEHQRRRRLGDELHEVLPDGAEDAGVEGGADVVGEALLPLHLHDRLDARGLQRQRADHALDEELLRAGAAIELLGDLLLQHRAQHGGDHQIDRDRQQHDERQHRRIDEHHHEEDDGEDQIEERGDALPREERPDRLQFAHARHGLAGGAGLEIGERQAEEVREQARA